MSHLLVGTTIVNGIEERFLFVVELGEQIRVNLCEQSTLENAVLLTEIIHISHVDRERTKQTILGMLNFFYIRNERRVGISTIEVIGKPLLGFFESW